jgi:hypothetical protein
LLNTAVEARKDFGAFTIAAQGGYVQTIATVSPSSYSLASPNAWYVHGIARWFPTDNVMLSGDLGYAGFADSGSASGNTLRWGGRLEYKLSAAPVSFFLDYQGDRWDQPGAQSVGQTLQVGLTLLGGNHSLAERYRGAAGLDDRNPLFGVNFVP